MGAKITHIRRDLFSSHNYLVEIDTTSKVEAFIHKALSPMVFKTRVEKEKPESAVEDTDTACESEEGDSTLALSEDQGKESVIHSFITCA